MPKEEVLYRMLDYYEVMKRDIFPSTASRGKISHDTPKGSFLYFDLAVEFAKLSGFGDLVCQDSKHLNPGYYLLKKRFITLGGKLGFVVGSMINVCDSLPSELDLKFFEKEVPLPR